MTIDQYLTLFRQGIPLPGAIGDSCAETARLIHLRHWLGLPQDPKLALWPFVTDSGFIRHPLAPIKDDKGKSWRETDFTGDQATALYLAARKTDPALSLLMESRFKTSWYLTGNKQFIGVGCYGRMKDQVWLIDLAVYAQTLIFNFKYRWSDSEDKTKLVWWNFEKSDSSSQDYLNWMHLALYAPDTIRKRVSKEKLKWAVRDYYMDPEDFEPNVEWLVKLYDQLIETYW